MSDIYCTIDTATREITVPDELYLFGVVSDEKAKTIRFKMENIFDDLPSLTFKIIYFNAAGSKNEYILTNVESDGEFITFDWVLSRDVTSEVGNVQFALCVSKEDYEWNSRIGYGNVVEGIEMYSETQEEPEEETENE